MNTHLDPKDLLIKIKKKARALGRLFLQGSSPAAHNILRLVIQGNINLRSAAARGFFNHNPSAPCFILGLRLIFDAPAAGCFIHCFGVDLQRKQRAGKRYQRTYND